ncbi:MAG: NAD(P)-dependent alcohol dehydrogenase [Bacteroidetes bacterium]|nr:NAD(P)-dependent alcohol dehydrogenase [Bacteroidota bacterium]
MRAIVYQKYGSPDVLELQEVEKPTPKDDEVLVKVHAASINSWDWDLLRGKPWIIRIEGLIKPKHKILGADVGGQVEVVGKNVTRFQPGNEVFGDLCECGWGGFAEYVCAPEKALVLKPMNLSFKEAAAVPEAAVLALQGLQDKRKLQPGQKVLINGAGGGVGTFAVQMARSFGAEVTGVDSTEKLEILRSLGADHVIDYTREDFTKNGQRYDLILDVVVNRSTFNYTRALNSKGIFVMIGGSLARVAQAMILKPWISRSEDKKVGILAHKPNKDLNFIKELLEDGKVRSVIDRTYPLDKVPEALRYFGEGQVQGKVIITI